MKNFNLPDLGEGLPDAEIVEWHVREGDTVKLDDALVSMETAKAVVDVPSPFSGKVTKLFGKAGDVIATGAPLASFELDASMPQRADAEDTGHQHAAPAKSQAAAPAPAAPSSAAKSAAPAAGGDSGTVVGAMESSDRIVSEQATSVGGIKAMPVVRALAKKLGIDLARVTPSGAGGVVTLQDLKGFSASPAATQAPRNPAPPAVASAAIAAATTSIAAPAARIAAPLSAAGKPMRTAPPGNVAFGQPEPLRGVRRNMARIMAAAHAAVVPATLTDDADIHAWQPGNDIMARLVRSLVVAARIEPALNAWFDSENSTRTLHQRVDVGIAVDSEEGLFVPALRNADMLDAASIRTGLNRLRDQVRDRSIAPEELKGYTIMLSNFGVFAGRYATPVVVPPCVAIIAVGKLRHEVVAVMGGIATHRIVPLSLTFDHRACTGGEAARFLKGILDDLALPQ
ncbi:2-oxo acid dehydrogenase subunit E2 [Pseudolysobacter antarcticus]|uniref:Dihydrolipoamide acetyltransferase component of pyruvate dehydrogenase complex n=1 Tax=Pseudolysobacter antarcticus TaxID=2511995 RepID=A0A411HN24_9GAMM|nr:dihydrolipoamide acetyltransferase family protein [Pseudolysobacter antarcticus]QBB71870.1 2-oxo acid dehydrogenase subunit E2 [Pseudolysobacter antarcticus]